MLRQNIAALVYPDSSHMPLKTTTVGMARACTVALIAATTLLTACDAQDRRAGFPRYPGDHVINVTATLSFDGEIIEVDHLVDCQGGLVSRSPDGQGFFQFEPDRYAIIDETAAGGMIMVPVRRGWCFLYESQWNQGIEDVVFIGEELRLPDGWVPVIEWRSERDPVKWVESGEGIGYVSMTAIENPNGRLRILEDFEITVMPLDDEAAVIEAARQAEEQDLGLGSGEVRVQNRFLGSDMRTVLRLPRDQWQSLDFEGNVDARYLRELIEGLPGERRYEILPGREGPTGDDDPQPGSAPFFAFPALYPAESPIYEGGIPQPNGDRLGLFVRDHILGFYLKGSRVLRTYDNRIPVTCRNGIMTVAPEYPGEFHMFSPMCSTPEFVHLEFLGQTDWGDTLPEYGTQIYMIYDHQTGDLWHFTN